MHTKNILKDGLNKEVERKFLINLKFLPDLSLLKSKRILQGYITSFGDKTEVRIRKVTEGADIKCYQTVKNGKGLVRTETEIEISEEQFNELWPETKGRRIVKTRYELSYEISGKIFLIEIDVYGNMSDGNFVAEVEGDEKALLKFIAPEGFIEITGDVSYSNASIAEKGFPKR